MLTVVTDHERMPTGTTTTVAEAATTGGSLIDEIVRGEARRMLKAALEAEVAACRAGHADQLDEHGHRLVVPNGRAQPRQVLTSAGAVEVHAPRVNDKRVDEVTGSRQTFTSVVLPAWCRKSLKINEVLPLLYLHGPSSRDFVPALEGFLGTGSGVSAAITRLTVQWQDEAKGFSQRDLSGVDYVYLWADGVHLGVRLGEAKLCLLLMIGVRVDGTKELIALGDGLLRVGRIAGGPATRLGAPRHKCAESPGRRQCDRVLVSVARGLPGNAGAALLVPQDRKRAVGTAEVRVSSGEEGLAEIWNAEDREHARRAAAAFKLAYGAKFGNAVAKITDDLDKLLAFYDFPAEHWVHLRTTNPSESFATVRHRTKVTKGPSSKPAGLAMAFKLIEAAQARGRAVQRTRLAALVCAGAGFDRGKLVECPSHNTAVAAA